MAKITFIIESSTVGVVKAELPIEGQSADLVFGYFIKKYDQPATPEERLTPGEILTAGINEEIVRPLIKKIDAELEAAAVAEAKKAAPKIQAGQATLAAAD